MRPGNGRWACQAEHCYSLSNFDWSSVNCVKQHRYALILQNN